MKNWSTHNPNERSADQKPSLPWKWKSWRELSSEHPLPWSIANDAISKYTLKLLLFVWIPVLFLCHNPWLKQQLYIVSDWIVVLGALWDSLVKQFKCACFLCFQILSEFVIQPWAGWFMTQISVLKCFEALLKKVKAKNTVERGQWWFCWAVTNKEGTGFSKRFTSTSCFKEK